MAWKDITRSPIKTFIQLLIIKMGTTVVLAIVYVLLMSIDEQEKF